MTRTRARKGSARAPSQRQLRVGEALRQDLAALLARGVLRDPILADRSITVTEVRISPDLKNATAYILPLGGGETVTLTAALNKAAPFLAGEISRQMRLRFSPKLKFEMDEVFDEAQKIHGLLMDPKVASDVAKDDGEPAFESGDDGPEASTDPHG